MTAMQIECGTFHTGVYVCKYLFAFYVCGLSMVFVVLTQFEYWVLLMCVLLYVVVLLHSGEVFTFGNNNHGQLGQGHTKPWYVCLSVYAYMYLH